MKIVLQRVSKAKVTVDNITVGIIDNGYVLLLGFGECDNNINESESFKKIEKMVDKIQKLRIFHDENSKINLSINEISEIGGSILVVSQFTLYADSKKGNRPSFVNAADPKTAERLYDYFIEYAKDKFAKVEHGVFGAVMQVELVNDGPFTLILEE